MPSGSRIVGEKCRHDRAPHQPADSLPHRRPDLLPVHAAADPRSIQDGRAGDHHRDLHLGLVEYVPGDGAAGLSLEIAGMKIDVDVHFPTDPATERKLDRILLALQTLAGKVTTMAGELADLQAAVAASDAGIDSAITLLNGLAAKIDAIIAAGTDPAALTALSTDLKAKTQALADAVVADARP